MWGEKKRLSGSRRGNCPSDVSDEGGTTAQDTFLKTHFGEQMLESAVRGGGSGRTYWKAVGRYLGCIPALANTPTDQMFYAPQSSGPHTLILEICNKVLIISKVRFPLTVHKSHVI